jgi:hypothetical protein
MLGDDSFRNPLTQSTDAEHLKMTTMVVGGLAAAGIVGYIIYKVSQPATPVVSAAMPPGILGPGGSTTPVGPVANPTGPQGS